MKLDEIETPALILEKSIFEKNLLLMKELLAGTTMKLRPHYKSHKCREIARRQMEEGASGISCAKLSEAFDLKEAGIQNILIANQIVQPSKIKKAAMLAKDCYLILCVDNEDNISALSAAAEEEGTDLHCLVEFEVGMKRCGVETFEEVYKLARKIEASGHLYFEGIQAYAGYLAHETSQKTRIAKTKVIEKNIYDLKEYLENRGLTIKEIGGGSTGTIEEKPKDSVYTDIQAGSYIFMDQAYNGLHLQFQNALFVLTTVISIKKDRVVTDTGVKSLGMDQGDPVFLGVPKEAPINMSEEHGAVYYENHGFQVNDKLRYIPGHCCTTVNMFDEIYLADGEEVVKVLTVTSRGKAQ